MLKLLSFLGVFCAVLTASAEVKQGTAVVKSVTGSATYTDGFGLAQPLKVGMVLKQGQTIRTGLDGSVNLFLAENGPNVGVDPGSELVLEKLSNSQSALGTLIDTQLNLKKGRLYGKVDKLLPGSNYEVKMPQGVAKVRGTEFYVDSSTGNVYVVSGTVNVTVKLQRTGSPNIFTTVAVKAGEKLIIPDSFKSEADFYKLASTKMTSGEIKKLAQLGFQHHGIAGTGGTTFMDETFKTTVNKGQIVVTKPPQNIHVSE